MKDGGRRVQTERLLIGCPVCQEPEILELFLRSLRRLELPGVQTAYCFVDDNHDPRAKALLAAFRSVGGVRQATLEELCAAKGVNRRAAEAVWKEFHPASSQAEE